MITLKVVCGIIWKDKKVFIARRKPEKSFGGYWEFPGGKHELNETYEKSLARELYEELGMKVNVEKHFMSVFHKYDNFIIELISYLCQFQEASFIMSDHDKFEWIEIEDIDQWNLSPADRDIAKELKAAYSK